MRLSPNEVVWLAQNVRVNGDRPMSSDELITTAAIWLAESMGETDVMGHSPTGSQYFGNVDHGGAQVSNWFHGRKLQTFRFRDPFDSMRMFKLIWRDAGFKFSPWNVTGTGAEQRFMVHGEVGLRHPFEPINPHTTSWRR